MKHILLLLFFFFIHSVVFSQNSPSLSKEIKKIPGFQEPHTPSQYNQVGYVRYYSVGYQQKPDAILVLVSGYISGPGWFDKMATQLVQMGKIEVWVVVRRQSFLEERSKFKEDVRDFLENPFPQSKSLKKILNVSHYLAEESPFLEHWGFETQLMDLKAVIESAKKQSSSVFLGGWSDGVEYAMLYSQKRFSNGEMGGRDLKGLVLIDENPEWGLFSYYGGFIQAHQKLMQEKNYFFQYFPSLSFYSLAIELAKEKPYEKSPLAHLFHLPEALKKTGITNQALMGWIFDKQVPDSKRGPFSYYIHSGRLDDKVPAGWKNDQGQKTRIEDLIDSESPGIFLFEWFYPRKILLDYWKIGHCGFSCPEYGIEKTNNNKTPIFYTLSGSQAGKIFPKGLIWFLGKSGISHQQVIYKAFPDYGHADWFFAKDAKDRLYQPLYEWLIKNQNG